MFACPWLWTGSRCPSHRRRIAHDARHTGGVKLFRPGATMVGTAKFNNLDGTEAQT